MSNCVPCDGAFVVIFSKTIYNNAIIWFSFTDIWNIQGIGKCYHDQPRQITYTYHALDYSEYHKNLIQYSKFIYSL